MLYRIRNEWWWGRYMLSAFPAPTLTVCLKLVANVTQLRDLCREKWLRKMEMCNSTYGTVEICSNTYRIMKFTGLCTIIIQRCIFLFWLLCLLSATQSPDIFQLGEVKYELQVFYFHYESIVPQFAKREHWSENAPRAYTSFKVTL